MAIKYSEFSDTEFFQKTHTPEHFRYVLYEAIDTTLVPITRGNGFDNGVDIEQFPIKEWGLRIRKEIVEGSKAVSGTINSFSIPAVIDKLPTTQSDPREYIIEKIVADGINSRNANGDLVDCSEVVVAVWTNVHINSWRESQRESGINTLVIPWQSSRMYGGEEYAKRAGTF